MKGNEDCVMWVDDVLRLWRGVLVYENLHLEKLRAPETAR
jgi:hypothetical protein